MKLPNAENAVIAEDKLRNYLLNLAHRRGGSKARLLLAMGYSPDNWRQLESDIRMQHLAAEAQDGGENEYGRSFLIVVPLRGPSGRVVAFRSVWQIDTGTDHPRLIAMYPEESDAI